MKRKLNLLCVIVMIVLSYSVLRAGYYVSIGAKAGMEAAAEQLDNGELQKMSDLKFVNLLPENLSIQNRGLFCDSVYNEKSASYVPAAYCSMLISVETHLPTWKYWIDNLLVVLQLGMSVWAVVLFIRLVISINKSDIFSWRNVRRLRRLGIALVVAFCCLLGNAYLTYCSLEEVFLIRGYSLAMSNAVNITTLVLGLCALIVGEVFAIGLKMKEDQDLTI